MLAEGAQMVSLGQGTVCRENPQERLVCRGFTGFKGFVGVLKGIQCFIFFLVIF